MEDVDRELKKISYEVKVKMFQKGCWDSNCDGSCFDPTCTKHIIKKLAEVKPGVLK